MFKSFIPDFFLSLFFISFLLSLIYLTIKKDVILPLIFFLLGIFFFSFLLSQAYIKVKKSEKILKSLKNYTELTLYVNKINGLRDNNFSAEAIVLEPKEIKKAKLKVFYKRRDITIYSGEVIKAFGKISCPIPYSHFKKTFFEVSNEFSYIRCNFYIKSELLIEKIDVKNPLRYTISKIRMNFYNKLKTSSKNSELYAALFLGLKRGLNDEEKEVWQKGGVFHFLAISGLHIAILSFVFLTILKAFFYDFRIIYTFEILLMLFFVFLTGAAPPVLRASSVIILYFLSKLLSRDGDLNYFIMLSAVVFLLLKPLLIFNISFIMSYSMYFIIYFTAKDLNRFFPSIREIEKTAIILILISILSNIWGVLLFNRINFLSFIPNLFLSFAIPPVLGLLSIAFFISFISGSIFRFLISISDLLFLFIKPIIKIFSSISVRIPDAGIETMLFLCGMLIMIFLLKKLKPKALLLFFFLITLIVISTLKEKPAETLELHFIDVHTGDSSLIRTPEGENLMIDCGGGRGRNRFIGEFVVSKHLFSLRVKKISALFITHLHSDHFGGCKSIIKNFKVKNVFVFKPKNYETKTFIEDTLKTKINFLKNGDELNFNGLRVKVIYPTEKSADLFDNEKSMALKVTYGGKSFLFLADIGEDSIKEIYNKYKLSLNRIEVLKYPHHGSGRTAFFPFFKKINPFYSIISVGEKNPWGLPSVKIIKILNSFGSKILRTDRNGTILIKYKKCLKSPLILVSK